MLQTMRLILTLLFFLPLFLSAQSFEVSIFVKDATTNKGLYGAKVIMGEKFKQLTDDEGYVVFKDVPKGTYNVTVSLLTYDTITRVINVKNANVKTEIVLGESLELEEIKVIGNVITDRKTPIPVTKIDPKKIQEELGSRDLPMLLNATPGVYATQGGGGDGDSRITVRGFDQRNIGVMIDGVPVNDMENGAVYWSNWFGLDAITSNVQLQRGLGATKLAMPSIGGTMNIITQGIGGKKGFNFKQEFASGLFTRTSLSYNSGLMKNGFGVNVSGSYKRGNGWVDGTPTEGFFVYAKVQKKYKKHLISLSAFTAPQHHGQRAYFQPIQYFDTALALKLTDTIYQTQIHGRGIRFNEHYGYTTRNGKKEILNERLNYYQKPQITLKDFWQVNKKLSISNILYSSIGRGGATRLSNSTILRDSNGLVNWDQIIQDNKVNSLFGTPNIDPYYDSTMIKSNQVLLSSVNNHFWLGYLTQFSYQHSENLSFAGGLDFRYYKGTHYQVIRDLLGGDYFVDASDKNSGDAMQQVGDKITLNPYNNHRDGFVTWGGMFGQMEYTSTRWTTFINLSTVVNGYKGIDYFQEKMLTVGDTVLRIGYDDTVTYQGNTYDRNSPGLQYYQTDWKYIPGFTFKTGAGYTISENATAFFNTGYLVRTPMYSNVINSNNNNFFDEIVNEKILAFEAGYSYAKKKFGINLNAYATNWKNKPSPNGLNVKDPIDPDVQYQINIPGMNAVHYGGEVDIAWKINDKLSTEIMVSYGDWRWASKKSIYVYQIDSTITFDATGVHVGDAAQSTYSISLRYEPVKNFYVKVQYMYFDRYYAQFNPFTLNGANSGHDAWKLPSYGLMNVFAGYRYKMKKSELFFSGSVTNAINSTYIADANDSYYSPYNFDARSAAVMFGQGLRYNISVSLQF